MPSLIDLVGELAVAFHRLQIPFAVGGALANNYWGVVRTTQDIDCLIALPAIKYQLFTDELSAIGCVLKDKDSNAVPLSVHTLREQVQNRKYIECFNESVRIELFVPAVPLQEEILRRAVSVRLDKYDVSITTAEDLILLKLAFHRQKDLHDIRGILWVQRGRLDLDYLRHWSKRSLEPRVQQEFEELISQYVDTKPED
jgi:predicted nucleotidyltransferase